jgi:DNA-directed RNA polymerase specialized sigma24 family protein
VREVVGTDDALLTAVTPSPEDGVLTANAIALAIASMPPARRSCAVACWLAGLRAEEAATAFGVSAATVRKQLERARADLAPYLVTPD